MHGKQRLLKVGLFLSVDTLASASVWTFASTGLHVLGNHLFYRVLLGLNSFLLKIYLFLLIRVIFSLILILSIFAASWPIVLLHLRLILQHSALL